MSLTEKYNRFLKNKIKIDSDHGFIVNHEQLHESLKPHQIDSVIWACRKGRALIACSFGLGKTRINIEVLRQIHNRNKNAPVLVICPLGVKHQFQYEDGPAMGIDFQYIRNRNEQHLATSDFHITNYERVRDGDLDLSIYQAVALDEGSCLRSLGSDTTQEFIKKFKFTEFKFVYTATPAPNEFLEIINYSEFLGVMDHGQALTRFFQRDSQKAGNLTIHPHHEEAFWLFVSSWALMITKPSDLGYDDAGYELPELKVHWHCVESDPNKIGLLKERDGQTKAFADSSNSLPEAAKIKRATIQERLEKACEIMSLANVVKDGELTDKKLVLSNVKHWLLWHLLEDERKAIEKKIPDSVSVFGSQDLEERESRILDFTHGRTKILSTKPEIAGSGCNFQRHCSDAIFMSVNYMFNDFIQAVHRIYRFLQDKEVNIHIIYTVEEQAVVDSLKRKWQQHDLMQEKMRSIVKEFGLHHSQQFEKLSRSFGCERKETAGQNFIAINNDSVLELDDVERHPDNSVGLIHTSIPFGNHYEYSASYNDFGHNESNKIFWEQMDFMLPNWFRVLKPGRNAIIHVKDRIQYSTVTGLGSYTLLPFSDETTAAMVKHGFLFCGRITVVTDVVRENNQTYRLGHTEKCKDGSRMGCGLNEYLLIFRKPQTNLSVGFADEPVMNTKEDFHLPKWQVIASGFWRSSGNRAYTANDIAGWSADKVYKWFRAWSLNEVYDYEFHLELGKALEAKKKLPRTYAAIAPESYADGVLTGINYMHGLNANQNSNKAEKHICPLPFDIVERVIDSWSMKGDVVLDPFGGLMTVPYIALQNGRKGIGIELNSDYFRDGVGYLKAEEMKMGMPTLFDVLNEEKKEKEVAA